MGTFINKIGNYIEEHEKIIKKILTFTVILFTIMAFVVEYRNMSCDKSFHMLRLEELAKGIKTNGLLNYPYYINFPAFNNFGYATELFYGDLFLIPPALLINLGTSVNLVYSLLTAISFIFIYFSMKYAYKHYYNYKGNSRIIAYLYAFSNYILFELTERNCLGANFTYMFAPWIVFTFLNIINDKEKRYDYLIFGLCVGFMMISHLQTTVILIIGLIIYTLFHIKKIIKNPKIIVKFLKSIIIFILSTAFFIFPMLEQMKFQDLYVSSDFTYKLSDGVLYFLNLFVPNFFWRHFIPLENLLAPTLRIDRVYRYGIVPSCFIPVLFMLIVNIYNIIKKKNDKENQFLIKFSTYIGIFCLLASFTKLITYIDIFSFLQFPWRVVTLITIFVPIGFVLSNKNNKKILYYACILTLINTFCYLIIAGLWNTNSFTDKTIGNGEYLPVEVPNSEYAYTYKNKNYQKEIIKNGYYIKINNENTKNNKELELPVTYYKGYKVYSNNHELEIEKSKNGLIQIQNSENLKNVKVIYKGTIVQKITKYISLIFYIGLIGYIIKKKYMKKTNKNK